MPIALVVCAAVVFVLCAVYFERRHKALEARMTRAVKERYAAYVDLEERVRVALGEFEKLEASFEVEVRKSCAQIQQLEQALDEVQGVESASPEVPGGFLGMFDEGDASVQSQPVTLTGEALDFEAELQHWERRVEAAQTEKRNEIERQRQQIEELTARLRQIEPASGAQRKREAAPVQPGSASVGAADGELEQRIAGAESAAGELARELDELLRTSSGGIASLRESLASCKPLLEEQAQARAHGAQLEQQKLQLEEQKSALEQQKSELERTCAELEQRCSSLDGRLKERDQELAGARKHAAELEARGQESARKLKDAGEEIGTLRHDLQLERERGEREAQARQELERAREELARSVAQLKGRLEEETARSASLGGELDGARARLERYEKQQAELEARGREQAEVLQAQTEMLQAREEEIGRLRTRVAALESKLVSTRESIGGQKSRLSELMQAIQVAQKEQDRHKELLSEQSQHMLEARKLLEQLRPELDTLEGDLEKKHSA